MSRFGFSYDIGPITENGYGPVSITDRRYGITDAALAQQYGYGLGPRDPARQPAAVRPDLSADGQTALTGSGQSVVKGQPVPTGGCLGEADVILSGSVPAGVDLRKANTLQLESFERSRTDSRVRTVVRDWSRCMAAAGFHYADPLAPPGDPAFSGDVTPQQIAVALKDIDCKRETNLVGVWFAVDSAYERQAIDADRAGYEAAKAAISARDAAAKAVLA
jgi:hypothetical protein